MMVINFLQTRRIPILPSLHEIYAKLDDSEKQLVVIEGVDCSFYENAEELCNFGQANKETMGELLFAFFRHFAVEFDYNHSVLSVRQGKCLRKIEKGWHEDVERFYRYFCIEEPFNTSRNLGNSVDGVTLEGIRQEIERALSILSNGGDLFHICERFYIRPRYHHGNQTTYARRPSGRSQPPFIAPNIATDQTQQVQTTSAPTQVYSPPSEAAYVSHYYMPSFANGYVYPNPGPLMFSPEPTSSNTAVHSDSSQGSVPRFAYPILPHIPLESPQQHAPEERSLQPPQSPLGSENGYTYSESSSPVSRDYSEGFSDMLEGLQIDEESDTFSPDSDETRTHDGCTLPFGRRQKQQRGRLIWSNSSQRIKTNHYYRRSLSADKHYSSRHPEEVLADRPSHRTRSHSLDI